MYLVNKVGLLMVAALLLSGASFSQNLVPNPSFEVHTSCPSNENQLSYASPWFSPSTIGTPDYYNTCATSIYFSIPHNSSGYQPPFNGDGYAGIYMWSAVIAPGVREYIEAPLTTPLLADQCYHFTMRVNLSNTSAYTTRSIGAYLSDTVLTGFNDLPLPVVPQIKYTGSRFDTTSWTLVSGDYRAHGGEQYIVIGNFEADATTDTLPNSQDPGGQGFIYALIDSVSLVTSDCNLGIQSPVANHIAKLSNPITDKLLIRAEEAGNYDIFIMSGDGRRVFSAAFTGALDINTSTYGQGVYFYQIKSRKGEIQRGKLLKI